MIAVIILLWVYGNDKARGDSSDAENFRIFNHRVAIKGKGPLTNNIPALVPLIGIVSASAGPKPNMRFLRIPRLLLPGLEDAISLHHTCEACRQGESKVIHGKVKYAFFSTFVYT